MHVLIAFLISTAIFGGFYSEQTPPNGEWLIETAPGYSIQVKQQIKPLSEFKEENIVKQEYEYSCGSASLATILNFYLGETLSEKEVIHGMLQYGDSERIKVRRAFSLLDMKRFVNALGYEANGYKGSIEDIQNSDYWPCIVPITFFDYKHFIVVKGVTNGHIFVADPWTGNTSYTIGQFEEMWFKNVMFVIAPGNNEPFNALRMKNDDLRFIDEDTAITVMYDQIIFERTPLDIQRGLDEEPLVKRYYKP